MDGAERKELCHSDIARTLTDRVFPRRYATAQTSFLCQNNMHTPVPLVRRESRSNIKILSNNADNTPTTGSRTNSSIDASGYSAGLGINRLNKNDIPFDLKLFQTYTKYPCNRFEKVKPVNNAIYGSIVLVNDLHTKDQVIMKIIGNEHFKDDSNQAESPIDEIGALCYMFIHKQKVFPIELVAQLLGMHRDHANTYVILEHCERGDLFSELLRRRRLSEQHTKIIALQLAICLYSLHKNGICHRDVSLENILLTEDKTIRLIDFGQARSIQDEHGQSRKLFGLNGKPYYMAPEVYTEEYYGPPVDVFAFGVVILMLATGIPPWSKATPDDPRYRSMTSSPDALRRILIKWNKIQGISDTFLDLITTIFCATPKSRPSIAEILCHPWFSLDSTAWRWLYERKVCNTLKYHAIKVESYLKRFPKGWNRTLKSKI